MKSIMVFLAAAALAAVQVLSAGSASPQEDIPARGMFLVADPEMQDPRFREAVILLLNADKSGAMGIIINKPTDTKLTKALADMGRPDKQKELLYYGGPVGMFQLLMLVRSRTAIRDAVRVTKEIVVTSDRDVFIDAIQHRRSGEDYRVFMGYSGWAAGQLEWELKLGQWRIVEADFRMVFHKDAGRVWPLLIRKSEEIIVQDRRRLQRLRKAALQAAFFIRG
jgi:putative transcriptional regulator